ncbi:hypothetical protein THRCLA_21521 [Thraustotheca clavata]|uniref:Pentacotripeptide-repeat region of PRORP domain-containing protein n=1 Tax=Thraustotheca clavata TaxID=74557 RepID=A0A1V9ZVN9_9STRA|nr:hypothetical protein THRCLA_21521 [Thraustotheca clavata]
MLQHLTRRAGVRALSTQAPYVLPEFRVLFEEIQQDAKKNKLIKVSKLTNLFKTVTSKEELEQSTEALKIYERKHIDPLENTAGEFVKACIKNEAADVALNAITQKYRIGLFLNAGTLNKLLHHFKDAGDDASLLSAFDEMKKFDIRYNSLSYRMAISALIRTGNFDKALELLDTAAADKQLEHNTTNHVLIQLSKAEQKDKLEQVVESLKKHNLTLNDFGTKLTAA